MQTGPIYNSTDYSGLMAHALSEALFSGNIEPFSKLLNRNATVVCFHKAIPDTTYVFLFLAERAHIPDITGLFKQLLTDPRIDPTVNENEALCTAANNGHIKTVEILLKDVRVDPNGALFSAAAGKQIEALRLLFKDPRINLHILSLKFHPSLSNNWMMKWAVLHNYPDIIYGLCSRFSGQLAALKKIDKNRYKQFIKECYKKDFDLYAKLYRIGQEAMFPTEVVQFAFDLHSIYAKTPLYMTDYVDLYFPEKKSAKKTKISDDSSCPEDEPVNKKLRIG